MNNYSIRTALVIFSVALSLRLAVLVLLVVSGSSVPLIGSDSNHYLYSARTLLETGQFLNKWGEINSYETPLYPLFLASIVGLFGNLLVVSIIQNILLAIVAVFIYHIGLTFSRKIGIGAALFFAVEPSGVFYSNFIVTEPLFLFFTVAAFYSLLFFSKSLSLQGVFASGLLLGVATMTRPVGLVFVPGFLLFFVLLHRFSVRYIMVACGVFLAGFFLVTGPWLLRNRVLFGQWELSAVASWQFYHSHVPAFYAYKNNISQRESENIFQQKLLAIDPYKEDVVLNRVGSLKHTPFMWRIAKEYIAEDPLGFTQYYLLKTAPFFVSDGVRDVLYRAGVLKEAPYNISEHIMRGDDPLGFLDKNFIASFIFVVGGLLWLCVGVCALLGGVFAWRDNVFRRALIFSTLAVVFVTALVAGGAVSHPRYRLSVMPLYLIVAAYGLTSLYRKVLQ